ncbi:hypothetical protein QEN19_001969 [Hanseniaspora menglaensis]
MILNRDEAEIEPAKNSKIKMKEPFNPSYFLNSDESSRCLSPILPDSESQNFSIKETSNIKKGSFSSEVFNNKNTAVSASAPSSAGFTSFSGNLKTSAEAIKQPKSAFSNLTGRLLSFDPYKSNILSSSSLDSNNIFKNTDTHDLSKSAIDGKFGFNISRPRSAVGFQTNRKKFITNTAKEPLVGLPSDIPDMFARSRAGKLIDNENGLETYLVSSPAFKFYDGINVSNNILLQNNFQSSIDLIKSRSSAISVSSESPLRVLTPKYLKFNDAYSNPQSGLGHLLEAAKTLNFFNNSSISERQLPQIKAAFCLKNVKHKSSSNLSSISTTSKRGKFIFQEMDNLKVTFVDASKMNRNFSGKKNFINESGVFFTDCYRDISYFHSDNDYEEHDKNLFAKRMSIINFKSHEKDSVIRFETLAKKDIKQLCVESRFKRVNTSSRISKEISQLKGILMINPSKPEFLKKNLKVNFKESNKLKDTHENFYIESFGETKKVKRKKNAETFEGVLKRQKPNITDFDIDLSQISPLATKIKTTIKHSNQFQKLSFKNPIQKNSKTKPIKEQSVKKRSKQGCWTCRLRKKKCSEEKYQCQNCVKLGLPCDYSLSKPIYMKTIETKQEKQVELKQISTRFKAGLSMNQTTESLKLT